MTGEPNQLLLLNQQTARGAMGHRYENLDWELIASRRDTCTQKELNQPWLIKKDNFLMLPQMMPSSDETALKYAALNKGLELGAGIEQYIDVHAKDPHLLQPLLRLRQAVADQEFDVNNNITTSENLNPYFLIAFGTGDGRYLQSLINQFQPYHIVIALADWHDFATSFWEIDWQELCNKQRNQRGGKITIGCYKENENSILSFLCSECHAGVDHTVVYLPPEGSCSPKAYTLRQEIGTLELSSSVGYLGYTIDELNMVYNSWNNLSKSPRIYREPEVPIGGRIAICGSGPSLDANIESIRLLSRTHFIIACGSNFRTLKAHGIRVDFLAMMERSDDTYTDIKSVVDEYGAGDVRLIYSSTCHWQMGELFVDKMSFFRPALTPLSVFSINPREILSFEGPESINTGVSLATALGATEIDLIGADLGSRSLKKLRSEQAIGASNRILDIEREANFGGIAYSSNALQDVRISIETCFRCNDEIKVFNLSDGISIKGALPCHAEDRVNSLVQEPSIPPFPETALGRWWSSSPRYTSERFHASWTSRRPRAQSAKLIASLRLLLESDEPWNPVIMEEVNKLFLLDVPLADQFPRRVLRSTFHKLVIAINRQLMVMSIDPKKAAAFEVVARRILADILDPCEQELYALCDAVESLPSLHSL